MEAEGFAASALGTSACQSGVDTVPIRCHTGTMNLTTHVEKLREQLIATTAIYGDETRELAGRVTVALEPATRLVLLDVLSQAADEISGDLAPGRVEVVLRAGEPEFVVTPPPTDSDYPRVSPIETAADVDDSGEASTARLNLRLPDSLKQRIEQAAGAEGLSLNAWLVRAASAALDMPAARRAPTGGDRYTGWVR